MAKKFCFVISPDDVPEDLSAHEMILYSLLDTFDTPVSVCSFSIEQLAKVLHCSESTARRTLSSLEEKGYITIKQNMGKKHTIKIVGKKHEEDDFSLEPQVIAPKNETPKEAPENEKFEQFWKIFPAQRKAGKKKPQEKFLSIIKNKEATAEEIIEGTKRYAKSDEVIRGYAKEPYSWLLNERWKMSYDNIPTRTTFQQEKPKKRKIIW